jgi:serine/threonine protein phosphatase PrpC
MDSHGAQIQKNEEGTMKFFTTQAIAQGNREYQEDRFEINHLSYGTLIWVADGHGGDEVSQYIKDHMYVAWVSADNDNRVQQIQDVFRQFAQATEFYESGSTLSLAFISNKGDIYVAVLGDSPVIVKANDTIFKGPDHNARSNAAEREAAEARGGYYANGYMWQRSEHLSDSSRGLQMTRALGDYDLKFLNREPEIFFWPFGRPGDYVLVATDGVIDPQHNNSSEADIIAGLIEGGAQAHDLVARATKIPTRDNATAILVKVV